MAFADDYNDVPARIAEFREKHPEGTLQQVSVAVYEIEGVTYLAYTAAAYRTPDDPRPGHGTAWERVPGLTKFTQNSELQNAETSAWGRAIIAVGAADSKKGVATREDIESRQAEEAQRAEEEAAIPGLRSSILGAIEKLDDAAKASLAAWMAEQNLPAVRRMNAGQCDRVLDHLMNQPREVPGQESLALEGET